MVAKAPGASKCLLNRADRSVAVLSNTEPQFYGFHWHNVGLLVVAVGHDKHRVKHRIRSQSSD